jgi:membrane protein implicated in regulation of membrane protease activity
MMPRSRNRQDGGFPGLLVGFFAGTVVMVVVIVALLHDGSDWVDFVAIALLIGVAALVLMGVMREVDEQEPPADDDRPGEKPAE